VSSMSDQEPLPIIVVDDDVEHLALVNAVLARAGYRSLGFSSARDALNYVNQNRVALVITDIFMPEMDGFELLRAIRLTLPNVCVITLSGEGRMTTDFYLECAMRLGAIAILRKPFDPDALTSVVAQYLEHRTGKSASEIPLQTDQTTIEL